MAFVVVRKEGKAVLQKQVDDELAKKGFRIRVGTEGNVHLKLGQSKTVGKYTVTLYEGQPSEDAYHAVDDLKKAVNTFPPIQAPQGTDVTVSADSAEAEGGKYPRIEGFEITGRLGEGGMGTVWRGVQLSTKREVAIKFLASHRFSSQQSKLRFEREVALAAKLNHPNIARIYDSGIHRGVYYYAMELIDGVHLDKFVQREELSIREIITLMRDICDAICHAHEHGVVHRDIKPSNIMVTFQGKPVIVDFGLAKSCEQENKDVTISIEGDITGTPAYMAPEQAAGHIDQISERTDVYALGVLMYQFLTGCSPHDLSGSRYDVVRRIVEEEVKSPRIINPAIDSELDSILLTCLAKEPNDRYPSSKILLQDVDNYLRGEPLLSKSFSTTYRISKRIHKYKMPLVFTALFLVVIGIIITVACLLISKERKKWLSSIEKTKPLENITAIIPADKKQPTQETASSVQQETNRTSADTPAIQSALEKETSKTTKPATDTINEKKGVASTAGRTEVVKLLLEKNAEPNTIDNSGITDLQIAVQNSRTETIKLLLDKGADVNAKRTNDGATALWIAAENDKIEIVKLLLEKGADVNAKTNNGKTALDMAKEKGHTDIIQLLEKAGDKATVPAPSTKTGVPDKNTQLIQAAEKNNLAAVQTALAAGADVNAKNDRGTALIMAAMNGNTEMVKLLLDKGADVSIKDEYETAIERAAWGGYTETIRLLLEKGADVNSKSTYGRTPLMNAALTGYAETVKFLLEKGANINDKDSQGETALSLAAMRGQTEVIRLLLDKGVDINSRTNLGETPLWEAAAIGQVEAVKLLLEKGTDVNAKDNNDKTPLRIASARGRTEIVKLLLAKGADINIKSNEGKTALDRAIDTGYIDVVRLLKKAAGSTNAPSPQAKGKNEFAGKTVTEKNALLIRAAGEGDLRAVQNLLTAGAQADAKDNNGTALTWAAYHDYAEIVKLLLEKGAKANAPDNYGRTPLIWAIMYDGQEKTIRALLEKGATINAKNSSGGTALMQAAAMGYTETVKLLLEKGADIDIESYSGTTSLMTASAAGRTEVVKVLLDKGADVNAKDNNGRTALALAKEKGRTDIVQLLEKAATSADAADKNTLDKNTQLIRAAKNSDLQAVQTLLSGGEVDIKNTKSVSALQKAAKNGSTDIVRLLLDKGADINAKDDGGATALIWASAADRTDVVKLLLEKNAEVNTIDNSGITALQIAVQNSHTETIKLLLDKSADANIKTDSGVTALITATRNGDTEVVRLLLDKGADVNARNDRNETALLMAIQRGFTETIKLLLDKGADANVKTEYGAVPLITATQKNDKETVKLLLDKGANAINELFLGSPGDDAFLTGKWNFRESFKPPTTPRPGSTFRSFRWTAGDAGIRWPVIAGREYRLQLACVVDSRATDPSIFINNQYVTTIKGTDWQFVDIPISAKLLDGSPIAMVEIKSRTWKPDNGDTRYLGVQVARFSLMTALTAAIQKNDKETVKLLLDKGENPINELFLGSPGDDAFLTGKWSDRESFKTSETPVNLSGARLETFRWTAGDAGIRWPVIAGREYRLQLACVVDSKATDPNIFINNQYVTTIKGTRWQFVDIPIAAKFLDGSPIALVEIKSRTFVPTSSPTRNLGIRVARFSLTVSSADTPAVQSQTNNPVEKNAKQPEKAGDKAPVPAPAAKTGASDKDTQLIQATEKGNLQAVQTALAGGAEVNAKNIRGMTALITAAMSGRTEIVKLLLEKNADVNVKANNGATALIGAAMNGHTEIVKSLLEKGADVNIKADNETALELAKSKGHTDIVQLLENAGAKK